MARRFIIVLLAVGAVAGFGSAFRHRYSDRREAFERHLADVCTDSALRAYAKAGDVQKR